MRVISQFVAYNQELFPKQDFPRVSVFPTEEQPLLTGMPQVTYELSRWAYKRRVGPSGHIIWEKN